ncbi:hypothetical protein GGD83_001333 [Rhodoblastus sphagnicola]|uniref:hypothetical protein n=1 Tax=Rhodoblastus sphagnicola TaxID=333368 RepID=UPI0011B02E1C|nr:hypothetical protein [Rhodoblastus sphagnicola]MBB4197541.1 hypothetical protein [Rhodoblastus sphagnicola]
MASTCGGAIFSAWHFAQQFFELIRRGIARKMFETSTFDNTLVLPAGGAKLLGVHGDGSAAAVTQAVCPTEWGAIVHVVSTCRLLDRDRRRTAPGARPES